MPYYYGHTGEQYAFFRIPKLLITDSRFDGISSDAKLLYGLLLDRMELSYRNGWIDEQNRVFIIFTVEEVMTTLHCRSEKAVRLFTELDNIGLNIIVQNIQNIKALYEKEWESIIGNCDTLLFLGGGNEPTSLEFVVKLLGKETLATRTRGQTKGRNGSSSTNFQQTGRELMTLDEVRKLGTNQAILFIRGESPVLDEKYNIKNHPNIRLTVDGKAKPYVHKPQGAPNYALPDLPYEFKSLDDYEFINMEESEHEETEKEDDAES